jgi:pyrroloquinoline quinone biosynthesis protein D
LPAPLDSSQPRLAAGCRWGKQGEDPVVLFPEGMLRLQGTGQSVLELCDGERTLRQIVETLSSRYNTDTAKIREDVASFLEGLQHKRVVDY